MKKIGILGHYLGPNSFGLTKPYLNFFSMFGEVVIITPFDIAVREDLDLLVLPGGPDVWPDRYRDADEDFHFLTGEPRMEFERFDAILLPGYIQKRVPIFGICRGHQSLAVHFGGHLKQHMYHETNKHDKRDEWVHGLDIFHDAANLIEGLPKAMFDVNSLHHQVVDRIPFNAKVLARYRNHKNPKHNEIEAITYWPNYPAHTVQWHPEEIRDDFSMYLIEHLLVAGKQLEIVEQRELVQG